MGDSVCHVRTACFPICWWTSDDGRDRLALRVTLGNVRRDLFVTIPHSHYNGFDMAEAMQEALDAATGTLQGAPTWTVSYISAQNRLVAQWGEAATPPRSFQLFSEAELLALPDWRGPSFGAPGLMDDMLKPAPAAGST